MQKKEDRWARNDVVTLLLWSIARTFCCTLCKDFLTYFCFSFLVFPNLPLLHRVLDQFPFLPPVVFLETRLPSQNSSYPSLLSLQICLRYHYMAQLCTARSCCLIVEFKFCQNFIVLSDIPTLLYSTLLYSVWN
jgi:hypothetical protein